MIIAVEGTQRFDDYETFMRAMSVALSQPSEDSTIEVWSAGPHKVNGFVAAFCNSSENYLRNRGYRISHKKLPVSYIKQHVKDLTYVAFFSRKGEPMSSLAVLADLDGIEVGVYRT